MPGVWYERAYVPLAEDDIGRDEERIGGSGGEGRGGEVGVISLRYMWKCNMT